MSVVVPAALPDQDRSFFQRVEDLRVQQLVSELAVETFAVTVLPSAARFDEQRADIQPLEPISDGVGVELRSVAPLPRSLGRCWQVGMVIRDARSLPESGRSARR